MNRKIYGPPIGILPKRAKRRAGATFSREFFPPVPVYAVRRGSAGHGRSCGLGSRFAACSVAGAAHGLRVLALRAVLRGCARFGCVLGALVYASAQVFGLEGFCSAGRSPAGVEGAPIGVSGRSLRKEQGR